MDNRRYYLLTLLPPLPGRREPLPVTLPEALARLREQGGHDLERLAVALEAETGLREALDEWVVSPPGSRSVPDTLPPQLAALFDEDRVAGGGESAWVDAVWQAWFDMLARLGRDIGSGLLPRWAAWERALRQRLAQYRGHLADESRGAGAADKAGIGEDAFGLSAVLAGWEAARQRDRAENGLAAAMEAEEVLEQARLDFLEHETPRYSFSPDELVAYLLTLRLLERQRRLDPQRGRTLLREVAAL